MIAENLKQVLSELPGKVRLVAVSKFHPNEAIEEAYRAGQRVFGESKVQEMTAKYESLPKDIEWHFIGLLQSNKIKYIVAWCIPVITFRIFLNYVYTVVCQRISVSC